MLDESGHVQNLESGSVMLFTDERKTSINRLVRATTPRDCSTPRFGVGAGVWGKGVGTGLEVGAGVGVDAGVASAMGARITASSGPCIWWINMEKRCGQISPGVACVVSQGTHHFKY